MPSKQQAGFNLIELMVALSVLGILVAVALPNFSQFIANTQIRSTAESIRNGLQLARIEAVKRNVVVTFTLANDTSWVVGCVGVNITANCPASIQAKTANEGSSSTVTLALFGPNSVSFTSLGTAVAGGLTQVVVDNSAIPAGQSKDLQVNIGAGGNTRVCDPNVAAITDSRFCSAM